MDPAFKMFDTLLDGVFVVNAEGKILYCNNALGVLLNIPIRRIKIDTQISAYVSFNPSPFKERDAAPFAGFSDSTPYREINFTSKSGREGKAQVSIQPHGQSFAGQPPAEQMWLIYIRDVTLEATLHSKYLTELDKKERVILQLEDAHKKLKSYSETLEQKVEQRTLDLANTNKVLTAMINSLGQAFVVVDRDGICSRTYSRVTLKLLETDPSMKSLATVLKVSEKDMPSFQSWLNLLIEERIPFEQLVKLGPKTFPHSHGRHISLEFHPLREADQHLSGIVVVATDNTSEIQALKRAEQEQIFARRVIKLVQHKDLFWNFVTGTHKTFKTLYDGLTEATVSENLLRAAHTLKGEAGLFWISNLSQAMHEFEELAKGLPATVASARAKLAEAEKYLQDFLLENVSLIGSEKNGQQKTVELPYDRLASFHKKLQDQAQLAGEFEDQFLKEPLAKFLRQYDDRVASIASKSQKRVNAISIKGDEVRILKRDFEGVLNSFIHIFSNAIDHGIEAPAIRRQRNKPEAGTITVSLDENAQGYHITIEDDGDGIDPIAIRKKLHDLGRTGFDKESDQEIIRHIFDAQFSTKQNLNTISGQGVGLNAVAEAVRRAGGTVDVRSNLGTGTKILVTLPKKSHLKAA